MLKLTDLSFHYHSNPSILKNISLTIDTPMLTGFLGPDGAGKSTLFKVMATLLRPQQGTIYFNGRNIYKEVDETRKHIGFMPERFSLYEDLSVEENLIFFGQLFGFSLTEIRQKMDRLFVFSRLKEFKDRPAGNLSGGMKQKLALSCMLMHDPEWLILDEPTTGVDPVSRDEFWNLLMELKNEGHAIFISSPYIEEVSACDRIVIMNQGRVSGCGSPDWWKKQVPCRIWDIKHPDIISNYDSLKAVFSVPIYLFGQSLHWFDVDNRGKHSIENSLGKDYTVTSSNISLEDAVLWTLSQNQS